jgi:oxygen-independent coproporphyrinogen-3 oxidase
VSAYSLIVEPGTRLARQVRTGALPMPDDDVLADRYLQADAALTAAGFSWYEVSNWARDTGARCRHNLAYWTGGDWWGVGPGAHSHVGGVRWWNVKHPAAYAAALATGRTGRSPIADGLDRGDGPSTPGHAREVLDPDARRMEDILLRLRLSDGIAADGLRPTGRAAARAAAADGLLQPDRWARGRAVLTLRGRLLADGIALQLTD